VTARVLSLPGDGIGPEVVASARRVLDAAAGKLGLELEWEEALIGGAAIDAEGMALSPETLSRARAADAVLLGAVGGPRWDDPSAPVRPEQGLLGLRKALGLYANLRHIAAHPALADASPLRPERVRGVDILFVRELTGGIYFGEPRVREPTRAVDTLVYTDVEVRRVARLAFTLARGRRRRVTSVDKANVLASSRLWRDVVVEVAREFPDVALEHQLVDSAAMRLVTHAASFDVIVTENMFGDILTDEAAVLPGSLGLCPSASIGDAKGGLYEPIHGSAPDIAGQDVANPIGTIGSAALLCRHSLGRDDVAALIEQAVSRALHAGARTRDLGGALGTAAMTEAVLEHL